MRLALVAAALALLAACTDGPGRGSAAGTRAGLPSRSNAVLSEGVREAALFDAAVLRFVNRARAAHGRAPLRADPRLSRAARDHAANMAALRLHSHRLPVAGQGGLTQRMTRQGVSFRIAAENIGMEKVFRLTGRPIALRGDGCRFTYADTRQPVPAHSVASLAEAAVARWMASPKHRDSILRRDFRLTGSGFGIDRGGPACGDVYLAQTFAG